MYDDNLLGYAEKELPDIRESDDTVENGSCGDRVAVRSLEPPTIAVDGCLVCRAATSKIIELCEEESVAIITDMDEDAFLEALGWDLSPSREDCALTVLRALRQA